MGKKQKNKKIKFLKDCIICKKSFNPGKHKHILTCSKDCYKQYRKTIENKKVEKFKKSFEVKFGSREKNCATCGLLFNTGKHKQKLNCSPECLKIYQDLHKDERIKKAKEGMIQNHGVDHPSKMDGFIDKVKQTKLERYGDENYQNIAKIKQTKLEKYGNENYRNIEKYKKTLLEKYGDENFNNRDKAKETILEKYGIEHHLQLPEFIEKMEKTNLERYGEKYTIITNDAKNKLKEKMNNEYGVDFYFESEKFLKKTHEDKIENIKKILEKGNLKFDFNNYSKLRELGGDGKLHYNKFEITCNVCNNIFNSSLINEIPICRVCNPYDSISKFQKEFREFLNELKIKYTENNRKIISPLELDFIINDKKIAIELDGNYYHSEIGGNKDKNYHISKSNSCETKEIKLIHLFEDEWLFKNDIVKSRINNIFNKSSEKIYARKCEIKDVSDTDKKEFLKTNHIQGDTTSSVRIGLFYKSELVSLMTFSKKRLALGNKQKNEHEWELVRFCSKLNTNVFGGFEKLLAHFKNNFIYSSIISYADCRWSGVNPEKTVYHKCGFEFIKKTAPSYFYVKTNDYYNRYHRFTFNKQRFLKEFNGDKNKTEWQLAQENKFDRIWDCGTMKFELIK